MIELDVSTMRINMLGYIKLVLTLLTALLFPFMATASEEAIDVQVKSDRDSAVSQTRINKLQYYRGLIINIQFLNIIGIKYGFFELSLSLLHILAKGHVTG